MDFAAEPPQARLTALTPRLSPSKANPKVLWARDKYHDSRERKGELLQVLKKRLRLEQPEDLPEDLPEDRELERKKLRGSGDEKKAPNLGEYSAWIRLLEDQRHYRYRDVDSQIEYQWPGLAVSRPEPQSLSMPTVTGHAALEREQPRTAKTRPEENISNPSESIVEQLNRSRARAAKEPNIFGPAIILDEGLRPIRQRVKRHKAFELDDFLAASDEDEDADFIAGGDEGISGPKRKKLSLSEYKRRKKEIEQEVQSSATPPTTLPIARQGDSPHATCSALFVRYTISEDMTAGDYCAKHRLLAIEDRDAGQKLHTIERYRKSSIWPIR
ncbi:uncharacterized protein BDZ99DRAFT_116256 [Mytilinidion resinicola]|uniref:Uncharacterized protein n=1 Tax=Mytilinidion resinicola TaxID=574789 RepID=A0A6A6Y8U6_9PEZI|nr:uncharacterized protein BDZ99DRAFT_116256 [Mytilinidion resinicola]KAF2805256.1 hypothetical protein BDZ99DRAFT_116256 [Mytilinidion resinicola]